MVAEREFVHGKHGNLVWIRRKRWLRKSSQQHALVSVESHCSKLLWRAQPDGDLVATAGGNKTWKIRYDDGRGGEDDFLYSCTVCLL